MLLGLDDITNRAIVGLLFRILLTVSRTLLARHLDFECSKKVIKSALNSRDYFRYIARRQPPLSLENKSNRLT
jgi:hypothetical protein